MEHTWSLVSFTLFAQSAVGLMLFLAFRREPSRKALWTAAILLAIAALCSLAHLSRPFGAVFTILNAGSSWLSREIWMMGIFGVSILACIYCPRRWVYWLSALLGLVLIYVMSRIYTIPTEPVWNTALTFWNFLAAAFVMGSSILLVLDEFADAREGRPGLRGAIPYFVFIAMGFSLVFVVAQMARAGGGLPAAVVWCVCLLLAGCLGLVYIVRRVRKEPEAGNMPKSRLVAISCAAAMALLWIGEICGRTSFYESYVWFGM